MLAQEATAPAYKVGDTWRWREHDLLTKNEVARYAERIRAVTGNDYWVAVDAGNRAGLWRGNLAKAARVEQFAPVAEIEQRGAPIGSADGGFAMRWPVKVGDTFDCTENAAFSNGWKLKYELKCTVEAAETIEVPAGKFETLRITAKGYFNNVTNNTNGRHERTLWYAPAVRGEVKREIRTWLQKSQPYRVEGHELLEFTPGA